MSKVIKRSWRQRSKRQRSKRQSKRQRSKRQRSKRQRSRKDGAKKSLFLLPLLASSSIASRPCEKYSFPEDNALAKDDMVCLEKIYTTCRPYRDPYKDAIRNNDLDCISTLSIVDPSDKSFSPLHYISRHGTKDAYEIFVNKGAASDIDTYEQANIINNVIKQGDIKFLEYLVNTLKYKKDDNVWNSVKNIEDIEKQYNMYLFLFDNKFPMPINYVIDGIADLSIKLFKEPEGRNKVFNLIDKSKIELRTLSFSLLEYNKQYVDRIEYFKKLLKETEDSLKEKKDNEKKYIKMIEYISDQRNHLVAFIATFVSVFFIHYYDINKNNKPVLDDILFLILSLCDYDKILKYIDMVNLNTKDVNGNNPLHVVLSQCNIKNLSNLVQLLVTKSPEIVNQVNNNGDTPLHILYKKIIDTNDNSEVVKIKTTLMRFGADKNIKNNENKIPGDYSTIECPICLLPITEDEGILPNCKHVFHIDCMSQYLTFARYSSCPVCRTRI